MKCPHCDGCGKVANTSEREPWSFWMALPLESSVAVVMGIVKPMTCTVCNGRGITSEVQTAE